MFVQQVSENLSLHLGDSELFGYSEFVPEPKEATSHKKKYYSHLWSQEDLINEVLILQGTADEPEAFGTGFTQ